MRRAKCWLAVSVMAACGMAAVARAQEELAQAEAVLTVAESKRLIAKEWCTGTLSLQTC